MTMTLIKTQRYQPALELGQGFLSDGTDVKCSVHECQDPLYSDPKQWEMRYLSSKIAPLFYEIINKNEQ